MGKSNPVESAGIHAFQTLGVVPTTVALPDHTRDSGLHVLWYVWLHPTGANTLLLSRQLVTKVVSPRQQACEVQQPPHRCCV